MSKLVGVVDLGTQNGVRFSITSVHPKHARILPCVFQDKAPLALFEGPTTPIAQEVIDETVTLLLRFRSICRDYGVPEGNVRVASNYQEAPNANELFTAIETHLGWPVVRLSRESESWAAVYGIASSFYEPKGVYIELMSGEAQLYWISFSEGHEEASSPVRVPYPSPITGSEVTLSAGAALVDELRMACDRLDPHNTGRVYISASGFSGTHEVLMELLGDTPMPQANGMELEARKLREAAPLTDHVLETNVANLIKAVGHALAPETRVFYCRHNIRDGLIFQGLDPIVRKQDPLLVSTQLYALPGAPQLAAELTKALPPDTPPIIAKRLVPAVANAAYIHSSYPKAMQAGTALCVGLTGVVSGAHGLTHLDRALLGLALCNRWGGDLISYYANLRKMLVAGISERSLAWWASYLGLVAHLLGGAYPGAHVRPGVVQVRTSPATGGFKLHIHTPPSLYGHNAVMSQRIRQLPARVDLLGREFGRSAPNLSVYIT